MLPPALQPTSALWLKTHAQQWFVPNRQLLICLLQVKKKEKKRKVSLQRVFPNSCKYPSVNTSQAAAAAIIRFLNNLISYSGERNVPKLANICFCFVSSFYIILFLPFLLFFTKKMRPLKDVLCFASQRSLNVGKSAFKCRVNCHW